MRGLLPRLIPCDQSCHIPEQSSGWALMASLRNLQRWQRIREIFQKFCDAVNLNVPLFWGAIMDLPLTQGGSPAQREHAENYPERLPAPREVSKEYVFQCSRVRPGTFIPQKSIRDGRNLPSCQIIRLRGGGSKNERSPKLQSREALVPEPFSFLKPRTRLIENPVPEQFCILEILAKNG